MTEQNPLTAPDADGRTQDELYALRDAVAANDPNPHRISVTAYHLTGDDGEPGGHAVAIEGENVSADMTAGLLADALAEVINLGALTPAGLGAVMAALLRKLGDGDDVAPESEADDQ